MNKIAITLAALTSVAALAANAQTMVTDTDGNGSYSMEELKAAYPDLTDEVFTSIDSNADGAIDATELKAAQDAGTLPA
jgi:EF hand